jgi:DNA gyrase subunit A
VTDENDLMIINKSGVVIRLKVSDVRIQGRATQGVRLINLDKRGDEIASVCKVDTTEIDEVETLENVELNETQDNQSNEVTETEIN